MPKLLLMLGLFVSASAFGQFANKPPQSISVFQPPTEKKNKWLRAVEAPLAFTAVGLFATTHNGILNKHYVQEERNEDYPHFRTHIDNYLQYSPAVAVFGLHAAGIKGKNSLANTTALFIKSEIMMTVLTTSLKRITRVPRPDTGQPTSFPSGHTAQAFAAATFVLKEYGHKSIWYPIGAYTIATGIGVMRVMNNRHWISDVFAGAGVGILSTNIAYLTHRYKWGSKKNRVTAMPMYSAGPGFYASYALR